MLANIYSVLRNAWPLRKIKYFGLQKYCPVCRSNIRTFIPTRTDHEMRNDALCPVCLSKSPHRRNWIVLNNWIESLPESISVLHISPEPHIAKQLHKKKNIRYVSGDIRYKAGGIQFDIAHLPFKQGSFDILYCCHVLMMIPQESLKPAFDECYRVLKRGGKGIIETPLLDDVTEELSNETAEARERRWGSGDVLRTLGRKDYESFALGAGFYLDKIDVSNNTERMALYNDSVYVVSK